MNRTLEILCLLVLLLSAVEPALANKFQTIGSGVSGLNREKIELLQKISLYAGFFFFFLTAVALLTRKRFEGFVGFSSRKDKRIIIKGCAGLAVAGTLFALLGLI
ncbi:MAG: hypothetical protein KDI63_16385 [Gammaproteobacteria bacterium]|nr:hypothetical protein [Gammaproteobacteria bacterium]